MYMVWALLSPVVTLVSVHPLMKASVNPHEGSNGELLQMSE